MIVRYLFRFCWKCDGSPIEVILREASSLITSLWGICFMKTILFKTSTQLLTCMAWELISPMFNIAKSIIMDHHFVLRDNRLYEALILCAISATNYNYRNWIFLVFFFHIRKINWLIVVPPKYFTLILITINSSGSYLCFSFLIVPTYDIFVLFQLSNKTQLCKTVVVPCCLYGKVLRFSFQHKLPSYRNKIFGIFNGVGFYSIFRLYLI